MNDKKDQLVKSLEKYGGHLVLKGVHNGYEGVLHVHKWQQWRNLNKIDILITSFSRKTNNSNSTFESHDYDSIVIDLEKLDEVIQALEKIRDTLKAN